MLQVVGCVALACVGAAVMAALSGRSLAPTALYSLSSDELHVIDDPAIRSLLDAPKMEARKYGLAARKAELAAQKDSQMLATATQDEREAAAVVDKDKALLPAFIRAATGLEIKPECTPGRCRPRTVFVPWRLSRGASRR